MLNMADALLVCEDTKTLAALQRQFVQAPDASNMADFLRISPWQTYGTRDSLREYQVDRLVTEAERANVPQVIYSSPLESKTGEERTSPFSQQVSDSADNFGTVASPIAQRLESGDTI
ncbi:MAG: hypothetical protein GY796_02350 [Chloroflexi bacterium]|nr:hypothetical protein [Chloroflexota bacterium]